MKPTLKNLFANIIFLIFPHLVFSADLKIEHIANAGVKVTSGGKVVLIDALFGPHQRFNSLSDPNFDTLSQLGADVAMATHIHDDHFGEERVSNFLKNNKNTLFIGTPMMIEKLDGKVAARQLASGSLSGFDVKIFEHNNINISALNFPHMDFDNDQAINFAYIIEINGWKVLHVGDGDVNADVIKGLELAKENIDIALIHDLFPDRKENYKELIKQMNIDKVAFVHMTDDKVASLSKWIDKNLPNSSMLATGHEEVVLKR